MGAIMTKKEVFTISLTDNGNGTVSIHASHTGPEGIVLKAGLRIIKDLSGADSLVEIIRSPHVPTSAWVQ